MRHIVLFQFKNDLSVSKIEEIEIAFSELPNRISGIVGFEAGTNVSPELLNQGFTHAFIVSFDSAASRDAYLPHPAHQEFVSLIEEKIEQVLVFDFET